MQSTPIVCAILAGLSISCAATATEPLSIASAASELGITPEALVVADAGLAGAQAVVARLDAADGERETMAALGEQLAAASLALAQINDQLQLDSTSPDLIAAAAAAAQELSSLAQQLGAVRAALFEEAVQDLSPASVAKVQAWITAGDRRVPPEFRANTRSPDQWEAIEVALRAEARALRAGLELDPADAELLAAVRAEPLVAVAASNLQCQIDAVSAVFQAAPQ